MTNLDDLLEKINNLGTISIDVKTTHTFPKEEVIEFQAPEKIKEILKDIVNELKDINKRVYDLEKGRWINITDVFLNSQIYLFVEAGGRIWLRVMSDPMIFLFSNFFIIR